MEFPVKNIKVTVIGFYYMLAVHSFLIMPCNSTGLRLFIFGDSLADVGNNNYIKRTSARANYYPHGIDFGAPTGRFTNNRTAGDIIGQELGLKNFVPPFLAPTTNGDATINGMNYASAASGILNKTGEMLGDRINFDTQITYHGIMRQDIISKIGVAAAKNFFQDAIYTIIIGSNDIMQLDLEVNEFEEKLEEVISIFRSQLTRLYNLGARKIMVANAGIVGCIPVQLDRHLLRDGCHDEVNSGSQLYNKMLRGLLDELNTNLNGSVFVYANIYDAFLDVLQNYGSYGFLNADSACCRSAGRHGGLAACSKFSNVCPDRSKYVFWDLYHPSDAANAIVANHLLDGGLEYMSPMNLRQLVKLKL